MQGSALLDLYSADLQADPMLDKLIRVEVDSYKAVGSHPPLANQVKEVVSYLSQENPPEDFLATLFSWLLKHKFVDPSFNANQSELLNRFAVVLSYDALLAAKKNILQPAQDAQLADTIDFVLRNMFPDAVNDALRRDLADEPHPVGVVPDGEEWKKAIFHGWAFSDAPPSTKAFEAMQAVFAPVTQVAAAAAKNQTFLEKLRARAQGSNAPQLATWPQICLRIYELTPREFLVIYLKKFGCHAPGLLGPANSPPPSYFSANSTKKKSDYDGSLIPKRVLFEMFRMVKTRDVWTRDDLSFLGYTLNLNGKPPTTIERDFVALAETFDRGADKDAGKNLATPLSAKEKHDIDDILESGQAAAALLSDPRSRSSDETLALGTVEPWLNNRFFLRSWLSGTGVIALDKIKDSTVERLKALYLYYSTCHDGWSQLHAFLNPGKLQAWAQQQGNAMSAYDDPSSVAQKHCMSRAQERHYLGNGVLRSPQVDQRNQLLFDAVGWHYMPKDDPLAYLTDKRLERLFLTLNPQQRPLSRSAMVDSIWNTLDSAPRSVFERIARARLAPAAYDKVKPDEEPDLKLMIMNVNKARAAFFQRVIDQDKILRLTDVAKRLHMTVSHQLTPVERGKSIILQYSRMMEVYGGKAFRKKLSAESNDEWQNARLEYFQMQRFAV